MAERRGRPPLDMSKIEEALAEYASGVNVLAICAQHGISRGTLYNAIRKRAVPLRQKHYVRFGNG